MNFSSIRYLLKEGCKNVWSNKMMSLASIGVLISCLLITGIAFMFALNVNSVMSNLSNENVITIYLQKNTLPLDSVKTGDEISDIPNVDTVTFVSKSEALAKYQEMLGPLFDGLQTDNDFMPDAYRITIKDPSLYSETIQQIKSLQHVESTSDKSEAASKLSNLSNLVATVGFWVIIVLSAVSLFIISNTIRITMYSRRLEINIMKSVGATNSFIRIPFIVEGIIIGMVSALASMALLSLLYDVVISSIGKIMPFNAIEFGSLALPILFAFVLGGILFGAIGGIISISRYLRRGGGEIVAF
jgi:cell division transport system permease protein